LNLRPRRYQHESLSKDYEAAKAKLLRRVSGYYANIGHYNSAIAKANEALHLSQKSIGLNHYHSLCTMQFVAYLHRVNGELDVSEDMYRQALSRFESAFGSEDYQTLHCMNGLSLVLIAKEQYIAAEEISRRTLLRAENSEENKLEAMYKLGRALDGQGKHYEAEDVLRRALAEQNSILELEHPLQLGISNSLAGVLWAQGKSQEVEDLVRQTLKENGTIRTDYPTTWLYAFRLGRILRDQGNYEVAEELLRVSVKMSKDFLGPKNPTTLIGLDTLTSVLCHERHYREASLIYQ